MTKQKRLPQIWQISTDAFCSKVLCKSAESVGVFIPLCLVGALREHLKGVLSGGASPERQPKFCVNLRNLWEIVDDCLTVAEAGDLRYVQ